MKLSKVAVHDYYSLIVSMNFFNEMIFMCPCHTLSYNEVAISCTAAVRCILRLGN